MRNTIRTLGKDSFLFLGALLLVGATLTLTAAPEEPPPPLPGPMITQRVAPTVALVLVGDGGGRLSQTGSGIIVRPDGVLLTAYHLIQDAKEIQVRLQNGEAYDRVELLAVDE